MNSEDELLDVIERVARRVVEQLTGRQVRYGVVTAAAPLEVRFDGDTDTDAVRVTVRLDSYSPTVDDRVLLLGVGSKWLAVGRIVPS